MIPLHVVVTDFGLQDAYPGLIVPFLISAFGVFLMRQSLLVVPNEGMNTIPRSLTAFTEKQHSNESAMVAVAAIASLPMLILLKSLARCSPPAQTSSPRRKGDLTAWTQRATATYAS